MTEKNYLKTYLYWFGLFMIIYWIMNKPMQESLMWAGLQSLGAVLAERHCDKYPWATIKTLGGYQLLVLAFVLLGALALLVTILAAWCFGALGTTISAAITTMFVACWAFRRALDGHINKPAQ